MRQEPLYLPCPISPSTPHRSAASTSAACRRPPAHVEPPLQSTSAPPKTLYRCAMVPSSSLTSPFSPPTTHIAGFWPAPPSLFIYPGQGPDCRKQNFQGPFCNDSNSFSCELQKFLEISRKIQKNINFDVLESLRVVICNRIIICWVLVETFYWKIRFMLLGA